MALQLYIGNKNYSSWSMRPWVLMTQAGIPFEEIMVRFDSFENNSAFKKSLRGINPVGKVPVLVDDGFAVWDTLAIAEYLAERFPEKQLWPADPKARARARSVCAEMHSGFVALRSHCPMNIEASLPDTGRLIWRDQAAVRADMARLCGLWGELLAAQPGKMPDGSAPLLFGHFSIADATFAPICMRIRTYGLPLPADLQAYVDRVAALPGVMAWIQGALAEHDFLDFEEPYRLGR
ncbi:glutathione S-transferase family protein [Hydrogenophaga sp.]|jgi:glutathione S-transferase|uniref:glutathione S-transferase family protein n=1 Tax=Hydrogenophaga sp. TaxID=1904254 RepID=UPI002733A813|nr:glutathione S-transferase family protein [Hydrogenophaga sp.]MDP3887936.1 glutathione S-transferase family protein [Hydrogenophaga sp.]MDZ4357806.1 glutathione S-transferase family protein [Variovorax sp.]